MRQTVDFTAFLTASTGFSDSPAAMVAISAPKKENTTTRMPARTAPGPLGMNPPLPIRLSRPGAGTPGMRPRMAATPKSRKSTIAATLMEANQNSNSPNDFTDPRLVSVSSTIRASAHTHWSMPGTQRCMIAAPAVASMPRTMIQNHA